MGYRCAQAASSSGESQSRRSASSDASMVTSADEPRSNDFSRLAEPRSNDFSRLARRRLKSSLHRISKSSLHRTSMSRFNFMNASLSFNTQHATRNTQHATRCNRSSTTFISSTSSSAKRSHTGNPRVSLFCHRDAPRACLRCGSPCPFRDSIAQARR